MNWIDEIFRKKLGNSEQEYSANVWDNIENELFPQKKDNYTGLWLLTLGVFFLIPIAIFKDLDTRLDNVLPLSQNEAIEQISLNSDQDHQKKKLETPITSTNTNKQSKELQAETTGTNQIESNINSAANASQSIKRFNNEIDNRIYDNTINPIEKVIQTSTAEVTTISNLKNSKIEEDKNQNRIMSRVTMESFYNTTKQTKIVSSSKSRKLAPESYANSTDLENNSTKISNDNQNLQILTDRPTNSQVALIQKNNLNQTDTKSTVTPTNKENQILPVTPIRAAYTQANSINLPPLSFQDEFCDDGSFQINRWYSEFYFSIGAGLKSINANDPSLKHYKDLRDGAENNRTAYHLGFGVGYQLDNGLLFEGGFEYGQYNYIFDYPDPDNRIIKTIFTIDTTIINQNDTIFSADTLIIDESPILRSNNRHQVIEIPLLVGFNYALSKKFSLAVKTGIAFNLYAQSEGYMYNSEGMVVNFINDGNNTQSAYYKSSFGLAIPLQLQLYFKATQEIDLFLKSGIKYYTGPITRSSYALEEKLNYTHFGAGFRVKI